MTSGVNLSTIDVDTSQLDQIAMWILGTAVVLIAIALMGWFTVIPWMRRNGKSNMAEGMHKAALGVVGVAILTAAGSWAAWNSTKTTELMPPEARSGSITIEKKPALQTCPSAVSMDFDIYRSDPREASYQIAKSLVGSDADQFKNQTMDKLDTMFLKVENLIEVIEWTPVGPDCTSNTLEAEPGSTVKIFYFSKDGGVPGDVFARLVPHQTKEITVKK